MKVKVKIVEKSDRFIAESEHPYAQATGPNRAAALSNLQEAIATELVRLAALPAAEEDLSVEETEIDVE